MNGYTYENSGVSIKNAENLEKILALNSAVPSLESFAGMFKLPAFKGFSLAATTDGVGTKIIPLLKRKMFKTLAKDLAAMNLNDLVCTGAKPLFFLDYIASNKLNPDEISNFLLELKNVLNTYNCTLLGGETSELGNFIQKETFDAAGFLVGIVEDDKVLGPKRVQKNDVVIGLKSTGTHSNGFSLIRKLYEDNLLLEKDFEKTLAPCAIYADKILELAEKSLVSACANITGGGILSNLKRAVPKELQAVLEKKNLPKLEIFETIKKFVCEDEMFKTFNMGAGFIVITKPEFAGKALDILEEFEPFVFGKIDEGNCEKRCIFK